MDNIRIGVLTVSDRCARNEANDESGPALIAMIGKGIVKNGSVVKIDLVADCKTDIHKKLVEWSDDGLHLILTTGGTGVGERDVTPEATTAACGKPVPGISLLMLKRSLEVTPLAVLSRAVAGILQKTLIINFPGSKKAAEECLEAVAGVIPHAVDLINGRDENVRRVHASLQEKKSSVRWDDVAGRKRESPYPLISVKAAQDIVMERIYVMRKETVVWYEKAHGHVLTQDLAARDNLPPFDASLKDGYAVRSSDKASERIVMGASHAGDSLWETKIPPNGCVRVSTGAAVPRDADAVVQVEDTAVLERRDQKEENKIKLSSFPKKGQDIRPRGSDFKMGQLLLTTGTYLDSAAMGLVAAAGITSLRVFEKPRVAIISTGDELSNPDEDPKPGKVRDSNRITLMSLLKEEDLKAEDLGIVPDHPDALRKALERAFEMADVVVTTGGMSMGERDYLKEVLVTDFDAEICFGRVDMKPGKPTSFGVLVFGKQPKMWFGLPGNPASALVTSHLFLLPALRKICGREKAFPVSISVGLKDELPELEDRPQYARGVLTYDDLTAKWSATLIGSQGSSRIGSCVNANCLLELPSKFSKKKPSVAPAQPFGSPNQSATSAFGKGFSFGTPTVQNPNEEAISSPQRFFLKAFLIGKILRA